jgi:hypothetical protein
MMLNGNSWPERLYSPSIVVFANFPSLLRPVRRSQCNNVAFTPNSFPHAVFAHHRRKENLGEDKSCLTRQHRGIVSRHFLPDSCRHADFRGLILSGGQIDNFRIADNPTKETVQTLFVGSVIAIYPTVTRTCTAQLPCPSWLQL